ncbi:Uncharacterized protein dnm_071290 [Desulfonema magnum]|uniref:Uncharacterized protein n=1 Tax=Desulfonema magnum TaxID=45655 RepID=A0A975GRJ2_9BACT|nr:Uncharacterized protein dnm_071290 [Desulfonema magnum]
MFENLFCKKILFVGLPKISSIVARRREDRLSVEIQSPAHYWNEYFTGT